MSTRVLREYAAAVRGDWALLDGRTIRDDLELIADAMDTGEANISWLRRRLWLCSEGGGHWTEHSCKRCDEKDDR